MDAGAVVMGDKRVGPLTYASRVAPAPGQLVSGDRALVAETAEGALVAAVDGLGHGPEAEHAAVVATTSLESAAGASTVELLGRCHQALRRTRGAAVSVALVGNDGRFEWLAVGNVQGILARPSGPTRLVARGGVVGLRLPTLRPTALQLSLGDTLVLCTDGVGEAIAGDLRWPGEPEALAQRLHERHAKNRDDSLVLVARFTGTSS